MGAYQLAQWGAEQAYLALEDKKPVKGQASSAGSGTVGAALAWQRTLQRTVNGGGCRANRRASVLAGCRAVQVGLWRP